MLRKIPQIPVDTEHAADPYVFIPLHGLHFLHCIFFSTSARPILCYTGYSSETKVEKGWCWRQEWYLPVLGCQRVGCGTWMIIPSSTTGGIYPGVGRSMIFSAEIIDDMIDAQVLNPPAQ